MTLRHIARASIALVTPTLLAWAASTATAPSACLQGDASAERLAFARSSAGNQGIWTMRGDGTGLRRITAAVGDGHPTWSPDGTRVAYSHRDSAGDFEVFVANADGTGHRNLTNSHDTADLMPSWSPDGDWIAFHSAPLSPLAGHDIARPGDWEVMAIDPAGTLRRNLSKRPAMVGEVGDRAATDVKPAWSPDSQSIVFESYRGKVNAAALNSELWTMPVDADATADDAVQLTRTLIASEWFPSWSPDGRRIAFMRQTGAGDFDVWVAQIRPDLSVAAQINLTPGTKHDWNPVWSPDGRRIAFSSDRADGGIDVIVRGSGWNTHALGTRQLSADTWDLYVMNDDGSCLTRLTHLGDAHDPAFAASNSSWDPADSGRIP